MGAELLSSKVVVTEEEPGIRAITLGPSAVLGAVGVTERGPFEPTLVTSFDDYQRIFGGHLASHPALPLAVSGFFENGGGQCFVSRICHFTDATDPTTAICERATSNLDTPGADTSGVTTGGAAPFNLEPGQTIVVNVDGGGDLTATFAATHGYVQSSGNGPYALVDGQTIIVDFQGGESQTVTIAAADVADIGAVTNTELRNIINQQILGGRAVIVANKLRIQSDRRGTGSSVSAPTGTAVATVTFAAPTAGTGNVANIDAVTHAEAKTVIEAAAAGTTVYQDDDGNTAIKVNATGAGHSVRVKNTSTATAFGFDNDVHAGADDASETAFKGEGKTPGAYANGIQLTVADATSGEAARFNLQVKVGGKIVKTHPNLSADPDDDRYAVSIVAANDNLIRLVDQELDGHPRPANGTVTLADGNDGLAGLVDADFVGGASDAGRVGLRNLDTVLDLRLLIVPGRTSSGVQNAMLTYCEVTRDGKVFAILDPPAALSATDMIDHVENVAALLDASEYAAIYWPRIKVLNPRKAIFGSDDQIVVYPSGHIAGVYARGDAAVGGVYKSPAGTTRGIVRGCLGFESDTVTLEPVRDLLYPKRINPISTGPGQPRYIDGGRTLKKSGNFPNINERRGVIGIKAAIYDGTTWAKHENNDPSLWARLKRSVTAFLVGEMGKGAFRSQDPATAFFVQVDELNNPSTEVFAGRVNIKVGVATAKPAEFVIFTISQDTRAIDAELAG